MPENKDKIRSFLNEQLAYQDDRTRSYVFDANDQKRLQRNIYVKLDAYLNSFLGGTSQNRWIALTGLRGAGKTTLLSQIFFQKRKGLL